MIFLIDLKTYQNLLLKNFKIKLIMDSGIFPTYQKLSEPFIEKYQDKVELELYF